MTCNLCQQGLEAGAGDFTDLKAKTALLQEKLEDKAETALAEEEVKEGADQGDRNQVSSEDEVDPVNTKSSVDTKVLLKKA